MENYDKINWDNFNKETTVNEPHPERERMVRERMTKTTFSRNYGEVGRTMERRLELESGYKVFPLSYSSKGTGRIKSK